MPIQMIELEEVQMIEVGDEVLEAMKAVAGAMSLPVKYWSC
jgi:hypothetical protein